MSLEMPTQLPVLQPHAVRRAPVVARPLKVGELAKLSGKTVRALHLYEELGLLVPAQRSKGRFRMYEADALTRVRWIAKLQDMGFALQEIRTISQQWEQSGSAPDAMAKVEELFQRKLAETYAQMQRLRMLSAELQASLEYLHTCPTCDPNVLIEACSRCEQHQVFEDAPDLVAGFTAH